MDEKLKTAILASLAAGKEIMKIYQEEDFQVENKEDDSPLTIADKRANDIINEFLTPLDIPVISEENRNVDFNERKDWTECWIVDPLDGTKEFIRRNGEFTVNIALVLHGKPQLGVIFAPALNKLYFGNVPSGKAYRYTLNEGNPDVHVILEEAEEIKPGRHQECLRVVGSRSHMNEDTRNFIEDLKAVHGEHIEVVSKGSSLKFCLIAEGEAHVYPRFGPTMEWDTAAGQAICEAVGLSCIFRTNGKAITYNRPDLLNGHFSVSYEG